MTLRNVVAVTAIAIAAVSGSLNAQDCLEPVSRWSYGVSNSIAAEGSRAVLANGTVLQVIDLTDPSAPAVLGELDLLEPIEAVALSGDRGYAVTDGLHVIDLTTPAAPSEIGVLGGLYSGDGLAVVGDLVHVLGYRKLWVVDAGSPSAPVLSGELEWADVSALDLEAVSGYVYLTAGDDGLRVVDVSDPTAPAEIAAVDLGTGTSAQYLDVVGDEVFISGRQSGTLDRRFAVVDVTDPALPIVSTHVGIPEGGGDIVVRDGLAHILGGYPETLHIYDVTIPQTPVWQGSAIVPYKYMARLAAIDDHILVTTYLWGLTVVETTDPTAPAPVGVVDAPGRSADAVYSDGVLFVAAEDRGLRAVDVTNPSQPVELGYTHIPIAPQVFAVAVQEDMAYVSSISSLGLVAVDVSNPAAPVILGNAPGASGDWITIAGDHAYVVNGWYGWLYVVDLSTPTLPVLIGTMELPPGTGDSWEWPVVSGDHLFVRNNHNEPFIAIINVGNPSAPAHVGSIDVTANIAGLAAIGSWLLVPDIGSEVAEVRIFDIRNPAAPVEHDPYVPVSWYVENVEVSGSVAYMSVWVEGYPNYAFAVEAVNFADPRAPEYLGLSQNTGYVRRLPTSPGEVFPFTLETGFNTFSLCHDPLFADGFESGDTTAWSSAAQ